MSTWNSIVGPGSMRDIMFDLIGQAEREGWTTDLMREAYRYNPRNNDLLRIYEKYGLAPGISVQHSGIEVPEIKAISSSGFEKTLEGRQPAFDFAVWREKMALVEGRVCRVEIGGNAAGTGFLVGPDAVLTNYHVLESVLKGTSPPDKVTCRFDYKVLADGSRVEGVAVGLHPTDWKLDFSPFSAAEKTGTPDTPPPSPEELDYALVRLQHGSAKDRRPPRVGPRPRGAGG